MSRNNTCLLQAFSRDSNVVRDDPDLQLPAGLSGHTRLLQIEDRKFIIRSPLSATPMPGIDRRREFRLLRHLHNSACAPAAYLYQQGALLLEWLPGSVLSDKQFNAQMPVLSDALASLHRYPLSGYNLSLTALLEQYWLLSAPSRRHFRWFHAWRRCLRHGEPHPLRVGLLHMDIQPGNIVMAHGMMRFIDWEYAGNGDIALELAAVIEANNISCEARHQLVSCYAAAQNLLVSRLQQQIERWIPWVKLLSACWYELRWQQGGDVSMRTLADKAWERLITV
ncbi:MAG: Thiamine kinase [Candidatus Erwinia impunctatus]|nr:Thiamine kinase [Culicoides impunctatus]